MTTPLVPSVITNKTSMIGRKVLVSLFPAVSTTVSKLDF
eukprot:CAMPEP_0118715234 /NCGR_PEP_ID=MMETSP0800-20121206/26740_1 /TAXON_ID=210618 ORGANISM="Striatella unipunctata, Strain CCMP2910" /NCGR_SAMPLE_ID=MMETSP0800 /ASSEMBLY_ACC=CAM_ASM_000638 /LENGTH=38 /DNA_ID= /DNA_START= /DNA_END= /DNA_ORIENTATION=